MCGSEPLGATGTEVARHGDVASGFVVSRLSCSFRYSRRLAAMSGQLSNVRQRYMPRRAGHGPGWAPAIDLR